MKQLKRIYHYLLAEPFQWIFYCFFQPARFRREFDSQELPFKGRIERMRRLALPMLLIAYPFGLIGKFILLALHLQPASNTIIILLEVAGGIITATPIGIAGGIFFRVSVGTAAGIAGDIFLGIFLGITGGIAFGIAFGVTFGVTFGVSSGIASGTTFRISGGVALGIILSIILSIILGITLGIVVSIPASIAFSISFTICYIGGYYRLPFYPINIISGIYTYLSSRKNPPGVFGYLHHSSLHWDERVYLPIPYLKRTLFIALEENLDKTLEEITFIANERRQQIRAARAASLEIALRELERCNSIAEIAMASTRLADILPTEAGLIDPQWITPFTRLRDASRDAARSLSPIGRQARSDALEDMKTNLHKIHPNVAFRDQHLNKRLAIVIERWLATAQSEQSKLAYAPQEIGHIDNPYKPGEILRQNDSLFVGRHDLAQQLEEALNRGDRRPTFLLNGERRMGKSTLLVQLPQLLGSRYLPIFFDLQNPGHTSNIATLLGTLAQEVETLFRLRGITVRSLPYRMLNELRKEQEAAVYHMFDRWLSNIEAELAADNRILLLTFDEFEKLEEAQQQGSLNLRLLLDWFRSLIQHRPHLALLFSGVRTLDEMGAESGINWGSYFVNVQTLHVGHLRPEEARQLITRPIPDFPGDTLFDTGVVDKIIDETGCHPFLVQAVCSSLIDNLNADKRELAELQDITEAMEQVLESWNHYFRDLWLRTDERQRTCLEILVADGSADINHITQRSNLSMGTTRRTLQTLLRRDLVRSSGNGLYSVATPMFSQWIANIQEN